MKQNIVSDRRMVADLRTNELYRRAVGLGEDDECISTRCAITQE